MMNPDGVFLGNTRGNLLGQDLNRHWTDPDPFAHPTVHAARKLVHDLDAAAEMPWTELDTVLDIHSHSSLLGLFVYGNSYDDVYRWEGEMKGWAFSWGKWRVCNILDIFGGNAALPRGGLAMDSIFFQQEPCSSPPFRSRGYHLLPVDPSCRKASAALVESCQVLAGRLGFLWVGWRLGPEPPTGWLVKWKVSSEHLRLTFQRVLSNCTVPCWTLRFPFRGRFPQSLGVGLP